MAQNGTGLKAAISRSRSTTSLGRGLDAPDRQHAVVACLPPEQVNRRLRFMPTSQSARERASAE